ncbi:DNA-directed DNA polymerase [Theileria orientalis]|uniref:DNA-directed DNA polymerase n=1 Tax=Theileria orientalis TaxID=68886 RepID=A0A976MBR2_THEOR|nr:DNA-directed DNA polymerase [Theileria orientalis]
MNTKDERLFLSFFEKLVEDKNNSKYINNIIDFIDTCNSLNVKNRVNGEVEDQIEPKSSSKGKEIIKNRKYLYKLVKNEDDYLQYTLDRLVKGISSGAKNSRSGFGDCLGEVLKKYEDSIVFDNLIKLFLSVYSSSSDFVLNKQVKYIYLGRLEIISQLYKLNYFKNHKTEHIEKIVEYLLEAYSNKVYLQDSSAILLIMLLSDLYNGNKEAYESVKSKFNLKDNNPSMLSLSMFISNLDNDMNGLYEGASGEGDGMIEDEVLVRGLDEMKNYYPILSVYIYFLVERMKKDEILFEKVVNVLNYMMESNSFNAVKVALITMVIGIFEVKNEHFLKIVFDKLKVYLKTVIKYYRYANSTNIKKFINNYLTMLSSMFNEGLLTNKGTFNPYIYVYSSLSKMDVISEEVTIYVEMHNKLFNEFFKRVNSERTDVMKEVKEDLSTDENDRVKSLESGIRYELLMKIGECVNINNINILNSVIKSILFSISHHSVESDEGSDRSNISSGMTKFDGKNEKNKGNNSKGTANVGTKVEMKRLREVNLSKKNEILCLKLFEELKRDENKFKYLLYLVKLLIIDNFYNLTLLSNYISNEYKLEVKNKRYDTNMDNKDVDEVDTDNDTEDEGDTDNDTEDEGVVDTDTEDEGDTDNDTDVEDEEQEQKQRQGIEDMEAVEGANKEDEVLELYSTLLVKYLGNLENKFNKLGINELNNYYTILVAQVNAFYPEKVNTETDDSVFNIRNKFLILVKTKSTKYNSTTDVDDKRTLMNLIVMIAVCMYLVLLERESVEVDKMLLDYLSLLYKYFNNEVSDEENRQLHYLSLNYTFNNSNSKASLSASATTASPEVKGKQLESMFELVNGLVWRRVLEELDHEFCKAIVKTTLTCDLNVLNSLSNVDYSMDDSSEDDEDDDNDDDDMDEDEEESEDDEMDDEEDDEEEGEESDDEEDDDRDDESHHDQDDEDEEDVVLNDYDKIYDELTTKSEFTFDRKKIKEEHSVKGEQHRIKEAGYSLLLNLVENDNNSGNYQHRIESVLSLSDLLGLLDDYVKSTKFNYNSKISKLIRDLSKTKQVVISNSQNKEELTKSKKSKKTQRGSNKTNNNNKQYFDVDSNVEMINKIINMLLYNRNCRGVLVNIVEIVSKIVNNSKLITVIVNYMVFLVLTKRTNVNVNILVELYKKYECILNMFKILEVLSKNVMKSQLLIFSSRVIEMNKYYNNDEVDLEEYVSKIGSPNFGDYVSNKDVKEDLTILLNHVMQFSETSTIVESSELTTSELVSSQLESENSNSPKRVKIDENKRKNKGEYSSQYVKAIVVSINTMYHYVNKNSIHIKSTPHTSKSKTNNITSQSSKSKSKRDNNNDIRNNSINVSINNDSINNVSINNNSNNNNQAIISETDEIFNKIKVKVASIQHKQLKKYFNNITIK